MTKLYGEISKMEQQEDGTVKVWGYASSEAVDSDGETVTAEAMKAAIPDYMKFGAVREMHGKSAAGTAIEINVEEDGRTYFGAHVVDPVAVKKVQTGVYKGFSIGGSVTERDGLNKAVIKGIRLTEISLVDRPANPDAVFTCFKADFGGTEVADEPAEEVEKADETTEEAPPALSADEIAALRKMLDGQETEQTKEPMEKSAWQVKSLASVLAEVQWFVSDSEYVGGHNTFPPEVVAAAKDAAKTLADALVVLAQSEAANMAAATANTEKSERPDDLQKAFGDRTETLAKVQAERDNALAELEALKKQAAPAKGRLKAVGKVEDGGGSEDLLQGFQPIVKADGSLDEAATLVKAAQSGRL